MSIASEITRLQNIKADIRSALVTQGVPAASGHDMADFSADILSISTGGGATITVTYSSQFYNKTMTCSKGSTTYTKITTSSGSTVFDVDETGTWTITCNGVSRTVDVVLEYTTQMAITKTITVYSAASDTVSFTDVTGAKTVTTNTSGQGSVAITFIPNESIIFTSSVAQNPDDLSADYSKAVIMDENITEVYVMPTGACYWFGYASESMTLMAQPYKDNQSSGARSAATITQNTNNIRFSIGSGTMGSGAIADDNLAVGATKIKTVITSSTPKENQGGICLTNSYVQNFSYIQWRYQKNYSNLTLIQMPISTSGYNKIACAIWSGSIAYHAIIFDNE